MAAAGCKTGVPCISHHPRAAAPYVAPWTASDHDLQHLATAYGEKNAGYFKTIARTAYRQPARDGLKSSVQNNFRIPESALWLLRSAASSIPGGAILEEPQAH